MRKVTLFLASAAISLVSAVGAEAGTASAAPQDISGATRVPLSPVLRTCDFGRIGNSPLQVPHTAQGLALVRTGGFIVVEANLVDTSAPGTHFEAALIQVPRPSSSTCNPGDPGVTAGSLDLDAAGRGTTTLQSAIAPGATGVWVRIQRPSPHSQDPIDFYTSEFVVPT